MEIDSWREEMTRHRQLCDDYFGKRAETIYEQAKIAEEESSILPLQALGLCMQIEVEFPNRLEELIDKASKLTGSFLSNLYYIILTERNVN